MLAFSEVSLSFRNEREEKKFPGIGKVWEYLSKRGISRETADKLGLHIMLAGELISAARRGSLISNETRAAIVFPHWKLGQAEPIEWWSARLVDMSGAVEDKGPRLVASFGDLVDPGKVRVRGKMFCPPNEAPHAYLVPESVYSWKSLKDEDYVYIHESCIKAVNGALLGSASVGLNGVWGWASRKHQVALVEELRDLPWKAKKLQPVIVFDSNAWDNWQVQQAEAGLAAKIYEITGRRAVALRVPKHEGEDQGFDDFVHRHGELVGRMFLRGEYPGYGFAEIEISELQQMMLELNASVCVVREMSRIAYQANGEDGLMTRAQFTDVNFAHFMAEVETDDGVRRVNVPRLWLADPRRVEVRRLVYAPGQGTFVESGADVPDLNTWQGMGVAPDMGARTEDILPWLELLTNNVLSDDLRQWMLGWLAYPLQNPGSKCNTYVLVFGPAGTGKSQFFSPFHRIYGEKNSVYLNNDSIRSSFTSIYAQKQFVHLDELKRLHGNSDDIVSQKIKYLTTQERLTYNKKGIPEYDVDNHMNIVITSNYSDCVHLDSDDRRAFVLRWGEGLDRRGDQAYWTSYVKWWQNGGAEKLYGWLLKFDIEKSGFDPAAWAPSTTWKEEVKEDGASAMEAWVRDLWRDPDAVLPPLAQHREVWTAKELALLFYNVPETDITPGKVKALSTVLRTAGFRVAAEGAQIRRPGGSPERWWIIKNRKKDWTHDEVTMHLRRLSRNGGVDPSKKV